MRFRTNNPDIWQQQRRASGARYNEKNRELLKEKRNTLRSTLRSEVHKAYGGKCNCPGCHVHHSELLTVDHVNGGASHRKNRKSTREIYMWLKTNGYPASFQLLCGSCNLAKGSKSKCPLAGVDH